MTTQHYPLTILSAKLSAKALRALLRGVMILLLTLTIDNASAQTLRRSVVAFDSGQRRYTSTPVKQVEDPSLNQPLLSSNQRAYSDDAKAFCR